MVPVQVEEIDMPGITFTVERGERNDAIEQVGNPEVHYDFDTPDPEAPPGNRNAVSLNELLPELSAGNNDVGAWAGADDGAGGGAGGGNNGGQGGILSDGSDYWDRNAPSGNCGVFISVGSEGVNVGAEGSNECNDDFWDGIGEGLAEGAEEAGDFFEGLWDDIGEGAEAVGDFFSGIGSAIADFFGFGGRDPQAPPGPRGMPSNPSFPFDRPGRGPLLSGEVPPKVLINDGGLRFGEGSGSFTDNRLALAGIASGNPDATNARTGDPVDLVSGALTLNETLTNIRGKAYDFPLALHYNSQRRTQMSLFGAGWDVSGNEALYAAKEVMTERGSFPNLYGQQTPMDDCQSLLRYVADPLQVGPAGSTYFGERDRRDTYQIAFGYPARCWRSIMRSNASGGYAPGRGGVNFDYIYLTHEGVDKNLLFLSDEGENELPRFLRMIKGGEETEMRIQPNPPAVITELDGTKNYFKNQMLLLSRYCGRLDHLSRACLYMLKYYPEYMRDFIPIGYYHRGNGLLQNLPLRDTPTHWLNKIELSGGREVVSIEREMTWEGEFVFPGSENCGRDLDCQLEASIQATVPGQTPVFENPVPREMQVVYRAPGGDEVTLRALWRNEAAGETGNATAFHYVPYVVEAWDNHRRHWTFDYAYPAYEFTPINGQLYHGNNPPDDDGMCPYDWESDRRNSECQYIYQMERGPGEYGDYHDYIEREIPVIHRGPLVLRAIHYPNPATGEATGPVKIFLYDHLFRISEVRNFNGETALSVRYDQYNRVAEQRLGNQAPIIYRVLDEADEDKTFIDDRPMEDSYGHSFDGYEVEVVTSAGDRSVIGIEKGGLIRYRREWLPDGTLLETAYVYRQGREGVKLINGTLQEVFYPGGRKETFVLRGDANWNRQLEYSKMYNFQKTEHRMEAGDSVRTTTYSYHENTDFGYDLLTAVTDPLGNTTRMNYDFESEKNRCETRLGLPAEIIHPDGGKEYLEYNNYGQLLEKQGRLGAVQRFSYYGTEEGCGE